jgi:hypothetical protein
MSMAITSDGMKGIIKEFVKQKLFRCVKFFDREKHSFYSENLNSSYIMWFGNEQVLQYCSVVATASTGMVARNTPNCNSNNFGSQEQLHQKHANTLSL